MDQRFLRYFNSELRYLRGMSAEFAKAYPKIARRLNLEESTLTAALQAIAGCDMRLRRSSQGRIQIEHMLFDIANINPA